MPKYRIKVDKETCIGCGTCAALCPDYWEIGDDGKAQLKGGVTELVVEELGCNEEAKDSCPVNAITIEEVTE
ncbi:MAG TPA: ferredoxin [Thermoprotei archaeon]|nr:MAG: ferredoxin [Thermoprotei archaeon]HDI74789.1 ferredoxin [Thermoprotei archaeon]